MQSMSRIQTRNWHSVLLARQYQLELFDNVKMVPLVGNIVDVSTSPFINARLSHPTNSILITWKNFACHKMIIPVILLIFATLHSFENVDDGERSLLLPAFSSHKVASSCMFFVFHQKLLMWCWYIYTLFYTLYALWDWNNVGTQVL